MILVRPSSMDLTSEEMKSAIDLFTKYKIKGVDQGGGDCLVSAAKLSSIVNFSPDAHAVITITPQAGSRLKPQDGAQTQLNWPGDQTVMSVINKLFVSHKVASESMGGPGGDVGMLSATVSSSTCGQSAASWTISFSKKTLPVDFKNFPVGQPGGCFPARPQQPSNNGTALSDEPSGNFPVGQEGGCMLGTAINQVNWGGVRGVNPNQYRYAILRCYDPMVPDYQTGYALEVLDIISSADHQSPAMVYMPQNLQPTAPIPVTFTTIELFSDQYFQGQKVGYGARYMTNDQSLMLVYPYSQVGGRSYKASFYVSKEPQTLSCVPQDGSNAGSQNSGVVSPGAHGAPGPLGY